MAQFRPATKTMAAINAMLEADQGAVYRGWLGKTMPAMGDAYSTHTFPFRTHLGASGIGDECSRKPWYSFRWSLIEKHDGKLIRLFNRGHLEEARFLAMLLGINSSVYQQDEHGNQFRISGAGGHYGGSGDGIVVNIPDLAPGQTALCEFKTANDKSFKKLIKDGVEKSKWEHYVQMQQYMLKMGIPVALYMAVNKNDDNIHAEIVVLDQIVADMYFDKGEKLVWMDAPPKRLSDNPSHFKCKSWCSYYKMCHYDEAPHPTCRNCSNVKPMQDGTWSCYVNPHAPVTLNKDQQLAACEKYGRLF